MNITLRQNIYLIFLLSLTSFTLISCTRNNSGNNGIIEINSIQPSDKDFSDLKPLKNFIGDSVKVVLLGEASHGDGQAFLAKTRLIEFLHEEMDFDVLVFESGMYDLWKANEFIKQGKSAKSEFQLAVYEMWSHTQEFQPLIEYVEESHKTSNPIEVAGVDLREPSRYAKFYLEEDMNEFIKSIVWENISENEISLFKESIFNIANGYLSFDRHKKQEFLLLIPKIDLILDKHISMETDEKKKQHYLFWKRFIKASEQRMEYIDLFTGTITEESFNQGDVMMADNIVWLSNEYFLNRKIVVWAHNIHVAKNYNNVQYFEGYYDFVSMGQNVFEKIGNKLYSIGFASYGGTTWSLFDSEAKFEIPQPRQNSFEDLLNKNKYDYLFMDFKSVNDNKLKEKMTGSLANYMESQVNWNELYDGVFYIKEMKPSTY